jgi:hypothetical protein
MKMSMASQVQQEQCHYCQELEIRTADELYNGFILDYTRLDIRLYNIFGWGFV